MLQKCPQRCDGRSPIGSKQSRQKKMCVDHRYIPGQPRENKQWAGAPTRCPQSRQTSHFLKYFPPDYILGATAKQEGNQKWYFGVWLDCTGNYRFLWQIAWSYFLVSLKAPTGPRIRSALIVVLKLLKVVTWFLFMLQGDLTWRPILVISFNGVLIWKVILLFIFQRHFWR